MNSTEIYQTKRSLINYSKILTQDLDLDKSSTETLRYIMSKAQTALLAPIVPALEKKISEAIIHTMKRLSRNGCCSDDLKKFHKN